MNDNINKTVNEILESYSKHEQTCRLSEDNIINKSVLIQVLEEIRKLLFPGYFDKNRVREEYIGYIVGDRIEFIQYNLKKQIAKALKGCEKCNDLSYDEIMEKSEKLVYEFLSKIPSIRDYLATDVVAAFNGDPAAYSTDEIILCYPGFFAITVYRVAHELWKLKIPMIPRVLSEYAHGLTGIDIHPGATIGKYFFIDHGTGIVVGETTIIGDHVKLYQGVTLGGNGKETGKRHPTLKDNVMVSAGAKIIGSFTIGENSKIGAGSVVIEEVPPNCTVVGVPGHIVKQNDVRIPRKSMDHIHLPDPIFEDIKVLQQENTELTNRVLELEGELRQMRKKERTEQK